MRFLLILLALLLASPAAAQSNQCVAAADLVAAAKQDGYGAYVLTAPQLQRFETNYNAMPPESDTHFSAVGILDDHQGHLLVLPEVDGCIVATVDASQHDIDEMLK